MAKKRLFIPDFETRSRVLMAGLVLSSAAAAQAQNAVSDPASPMSPASVTSGAAAPIPPNRSSAKDLDAAFRQADANHDGKLSRDEVSRFPVLAQQFERIDINHDGFISPEEFNKAANS